MNWTEFSEDNDGSSHQIRTLEDFRWNSSKTRAVQSHLHTFGPYVASSSMQIKLGQINVIFCYKSIVEWRLGIICETNFWKINLKPPSECDRFWLSACAFSPVSFSRWPPSTTRLSTIIQKAGRWPRKARRLEMVSNISSRLETTRLKSLIHTACGTGNMIFHQLNNGQLYCDCKTNDFQSWMETVHNLLPYCVKCKDLPDRCIWPDDNCCYPIKELDKKKRDKDGRCVPA